MFQQHDNAQDAQYMQDAQERHGGAMSGIEVYKTYQEIKARPVGHVQNYVEQEEKPDTGDLKPAQIRGLKMFSIVSFVGSMCYGIICVFASGAMNMVLQVGACGLFLAACLSAIGGGGNTSKNSSGSNSGKNEHHHYHQYNNFGGDQKNG